MDWRWTNYGCSTQKVYTYSGVSASHLSLSLLGFFLLIYNVLESVDSWLVETSHWNNKIDYKGFKLRTFSVRSLDGRGELVHIDYSSKTNYVLCSNNKSTVHEKWSQLSSRLILRRRNQIYILIFIICLNEFMSDSEHYFSIHQVISPCLELVTYPYTIRIFPFSFLLFTFWIRQRNLNSQF